MSKPEERKMKMTSCSRCEGNGEFFHPLYQLAELAKSGPSGVVLVTSERKWDLDGIPQIKVVCPICGGAGKAERPPAQSKLAKTGGRI